MDSMSRQSGCLWTPGNDYTIALFYRYVAITDPVAFVGDLRQGCEKYELLGRILVSKEGINGTLAGGVAAIDAFVTDMTADARFAHIDWKFTQDKGDSLPFLGLSIRVVDEIIASGRAASFINENITFDDATYGGITGTGTHLTPTEFHNALARNDGIVLDIRNEFEYDIGHFKDSKNLKTFNYAETFDALDQVLSPPSAGSESTEETCAELKKKEAGSEQNIYMYCTGGIRCEKASAYLCAKGFTNVYQLEGGIHRYLETFPDGGLFQGKNFVFDSRVSVGPAAATSEGFANSVSAGLSREGEGEGGEERAVGAAEGGAAVGAESAGVVGRCIDCSSLHDVYSGFIVCTVCRMPVLVCPSCVQSNPAQGEYHCSRHRDLKELYFTVLTSFSLAQLQAQLAGLQELVKESQGHLEQVRRAERLHRAELQKLSHAKRKADASQDLQHQVEPSDAADQQHVNNAPAADARSEEEVPEKEEKEGREEKEEKGRNAEELSARAQLGKQRRRTLRKQIERLEARIKALKSEQKEAMQSGEEEVNVADASNTQYNPKTRGGWGFWKT